VRGCAGLRKEVRPARPPVGAAAVESELAEKDWEGATAGVAAGGGAPAKSAKSEGDC